MKKNLWIFLLVGIIILVVLLLRKKDTLTLAGGVPEYLPGNDIPVELEPPPGKSGITAPIQNGRYQPFPMPMPAPIQLITDFDYLAYRERLKELSPFARRLLERKGY